MQPIIQFYWQLLEHCRNDIGGSILTQGILSLAKKAKPSWIATEENVRLVREWYLDSNELNSGTNAKEKRLTAHKLMLDLLAAAFKDLSPLKNPAAMALFFEIKQAFCLPEDVFVWARNIKQREDGSGVIILHVSDVDTFRRTMEAGRMGVRGRTLEKVLLIDGSE